MSHGKRPLSTITPAITTPWPPMNLVAEWTTMSAPCSMGRHRYGVANVLSITRGMPWEWATSANPSMSSTSARVADRLAVDELRSVGDGGVDRIEVGGSTKVVSIPILRNVTSNWVKVPP